MTDNLPRLYTEEEAATYLGLNSRTLARLRQRGDIGYLEIADRRYRYLEEHMVIFLRKRTRGPALPAASLHPDRQVRSAHNSAFDELDAPPFFRKPRRG